MEKDAAKSLRTPSPESSAPRNVRYLWTSEHMISPDNEPSAMSSCFILFKVLLAALDGEGVNAVPMLTQLPCMPSSAEVLCW